MLLVALSAVLAAGTIQTDVEAISPQSVSDLQACATQRLSRFGRVVVSPRENGAQIDFGKKGALLGPPGSAMMTFAIDDRGADRRITLAYRHPYSLKLATGLFWDLGKTCFPEVPRP